MPSILRYPTTAAGTYWTNPNNIKVEDGNYAVSSYWVGTGHDHGTSGDITGSAYDFNLPSTAIIDGIVVEAKFGGTRLGGTNSVQIGNTGSAKTAAKTNNDGSAAQMWYSYGGPTDLWGRTDWLVSDFNNSFYATINFQATSSPADAVANVDVMRVTVYWHTAPADVETREVYKVRNANGDYLGVLPQPVDPLGLSQDINSLGSQITIKVPVSPDTSAQPTEPYITEDASATYTAEDGTSPYVSSGGVPIVSPAFSGFDTLVKNGNIVEVWLFNYFYPNGKCMFIGKMRRWEAEFGNDTDLISIACYAVGYDMDNYLTRGAPFSYSNDQTQTANNGYVTVSNYFNGGNKGGGWNIYGQTFTVGAGVTNTGAITLLLAGSASVIVRLYSQVNGVLLGESTIGVNVVNPSAIQFAFPTLATAAPGAQYFFSVDTTDGNTIRLYYNSSDVYAGGEMYNSSYGGGGGGGWGSLPGDLYFITSSGTNSTTATFTNKDPSTGMLAPIITDYNLRGGSIVWKASTIDATGLSLTYTFKVQTVYEALQAILSLAPNGFYYYVDLGTLTIYFKNQSSTPEFTIIKGVHIENLKLVSTTENMKNTIMFSGGEVSPGVNLYKQYQSAASIATFGPLIDRKSDNRVTLDATADAIGTSALAELSGEVQQTTVVIPHTQRLDITLLTPGKVVGFRGFGTFVDNLLVQIVHRDWTADKVALTLGILPQRLNDEYELTNRQLIAQQTQDNPSTPS